MDYKQRRYKDYPSARAYLEHILNNWHSFIHHNSGICQAIQDILDENEMLRDELERIWKK